MGYSNKIYVVQYGSNICIKKKTYNLEHSNFFISLYKLQKKDDPYLQSLSDNLWLRQRLYTVFLKQVKLFIRINSYYPYFIYLNHVISYKLTELKYRTRHVLNYCNCFHCSQEGSVDGDRPSVLK